VGRDTLPATAYELLAGGPGTTLEPFEVPVELLADLDVYPLIITPDYVGADRRSAIRSPAIHQYPTPRPPAIRQYYAPRETGRSVRAFEVLVIMVITMAIAIPLTLMASHASAPARSSLPSASAQKKASTTAHVRTVALERQAASQRSRAIHQAARARLNTERRARRAGAASRRAARARSAQVLRARRAESRAAAARHRKLTRAVRTRPGTHSRSRARTH
jgi:hypothetical protein